MKSIKEKIEEILSEFEPALQNECLKYKLNFKDNHTVPTFAFYEGALWAHKRLESIVRSAGELAERLSESLTYAQEFTDGCLYCGEGEIVDGTTTEEHRKDCWYYKAEKQLSEFEKSINGGEL